MDNLIRSKEDLSKRLRGIEVAKKQVQGVYVKERLLDDMHVETMKQIKWIEKTINGSNGKNGVHGVNGSNGSKSIYHRFVHWISG